MNIIVLLSIINKIIKVLEKIWNIIYNMHISDDVEEYIITVYRELSNGESLIISVIEGSYWV